MAQQLPTQSQFGDYSDWPGRDVLDASGQRLGAVREIYLDRDSGRPEWVLVDLTESEARFVPLVGADVESSSIRVAQPAEKIRSAPGIGAEPRIDHSEERRLYAHYGLTDGAPDSGDPSWQARGGETGDRDTAGSPPSSTWSQADESSTPAAYSLTDDQSTRGTDTPTTRTDEPAAFTDGPATGTDEPAGATDGPATGTDESAGSTDGPTTRTDEPAAYALSGDPTNDAPPPAEPPSPAELEAAQPADEPPATSDRATDYETAPFGAVAPPRADDTTAGADTPSPSASAERDDPSRAPATDSPAAFTTADAPDHYGANHSPAAPGGDTPSSADDAAPARDVELTPPESSSFAPPEQPASIIPEPPVTADAPVADDTPPGTPELTPHAATPKSPPPPGWSSPSGQEAEHPGALERVKRSPTRIAVAGAAAAVLFFIVRKLR